MFNENKTIASLIWPSILKFLDTQTLVRFSLVSILSRKLAFRNIDRFEFERLTEKALNFSIREANIRKNGDGNLRLNFNFGTIEMDMIKKHRQKIKVLFQLLIENTNPYSFTIIDKDFTALVKLLNKIDLKKNLEEIRLRVYSLDNKKLKDLFLKLPSSLKSLAIISWNDHTDSYDSSSLCFKLDLCSLFPKLEKLEIDVPKIDNPPLSFPANLRTLVIQTHYFSSKERFDLSQQFPYLENLRITVGGENVTQRHLILPSNLRTLEIPTVYFLAQDLDLYEFSRLEKLKCRDWFKENAKPPSKLSNVRKLEIILLYHPEVNLDFSQFSNLEELNIFAQSAKVLLFVPPSNLRKLVISLSELNEDDFFTKPRDLSELSYLRELRITIWDKPYELLSTLPSNLRVLKTHLSHFPTKSLNFSALALLEELVLSNSCQNNNDQKIVHLTLPNPNNLRTLEISKNYFLKKHLDFSRQFPHLEELTLVEGFPELSYGKNDPRPLLPSNLRTLNIAQSTFLAKSFDLSQLSRLEKLILDPNCVTDPDEISTIISEIAKYPINLKCLMINSRDHIQEYLQMKKPSFFAQVSTVFARSSGGNESTSDCTIQ